MIDSAAEIIPLRGDAPATYAGAIDAYLRAAGIGASSRRIYRISLATWAWLAHGTQPPIGKQRRGATVPELFLADLGHPAAAARIAAAFAERATLADADTVNRELSVLRAAIAWWRARGWLAAEPTAGLERRPAPPDRTRALTRDQIAALFELKTGLREKTL
ncbi:hypothetical protein [Streptosporangium sp. V21-05]|uniref:hypothetical protein n=1 Tax=Streptosporangium sp. V21-05 TaxID=3446115 RepID=UPI003F53891F